MLTEKDDPAVAARLPPFSRVEFPTLRLSIEEGRTSFEVNSMVLVKRGSSVPSFKRALSTLTTSLSSSVASAR